VRAWIIYRVEGQCKSCEAEHTGRFCKTVGEALSERNRLRETRPEIEWRVVRVTEEEVTE
jgi:hypothetical protein